MRLIFLCFLLVLFVTACSTFESKPALIEKLEKEGYDFQLQQNISDKVAFAGVKNNNWIIVYDDKVYGPYLNEYNSYCARAPIMKEAFGKLLFAVYDKTNWFVFLDGEKIATFDAVSPYDFARTGASTVKYMGVIGGKLVLNGFKNGKRILLADGVVIGEEYDKVLFPFCVDGKLAYLAIEENQEHQEQKPEHQEYLIIDNKVVDSAKQIFVSNLDSCIPFSKLEYVKAVDDKDIRVVGGVEQKKYESIGGARNFDGKRAYIARENGSEFVLFNSVPSEKYERIEFRYFMNDALIFIGKNYTDGGYLDYQKFLQVFHGPRAGPYGAVHYKPKEYKDKLEFLVLKDCIIHTVYLDKAEKWIINTEDESKGCIPCTVTWDGTDWKENCNY